MKEKRQFVGICQETGKKVRITLNFEVTTRNGFLEPSYSGEIEYQAGNNHFYWSNCGQCDDSIREVIEEDSFSIEDKKAIESILADWKMYHLAEMSGLTPRQREYLNRKFAEIGETFNVDTNYEKAKKILRDGGLEFDTIPETHFSHGNGGINENGLYRAWHGWIHIKIDEKIISKLKENFLK